MINPKNWTISKLKEWLNQISTEENDFFDLKEKIPSKEDKKGKDRLKKEFCAFANCGGGYLFFGVKDNKSIPGLGRIKDFRTKISQIITKNISPSNINWQLYQVIPFSIKRPRKFVYIIKIEESVYYNKPHVFYKEKIGLIIPIRRNGHLDFIKEGREIRELMLLDRKFYPEYITHAKKILENLKSASNINFSFLENIILQGFKSYIIENSSKIKDSNDLLKSIFNVEKLISEINKQLGSNATEKTNQYQNLKVKLENAIDQCLIELTNLT